MKLIEFFKEVYAPGLHLAYAAFWFLALEGTLVLTASSGQPWALDLSVVAAIATIFLVLFFLRVADEWKDYEYDRVHNPDRPLVRGLVTRRHLVIYMVGAAALVLGINLWLGARLGWLLPVIVLADMVWGVTLIGLENRSRAVRDGMFLNLFVTYPVNIALSIYTYIFFLARYGVEFSLRGSLVVLAFVLAFLNYEFGRKTVWPHLSESSERLYSNVIGGYGAIALTFGCALGAALLLLGVTQPWNADGIFVVVGLIIVLPLLPAMKGLTRFLKERSLRISLKKIGLQFLLLFYIALFVHALLVNSLTTSWS